MRKRNGFLKLALLGAGFSIVTGSSVASAFTVPWCSESYRSDSYGAGLEAAFSNQAKRPETIDEGCYQLGRQAGQLLLTNDPLDCRQNFSDGFSEGIQASALGAGSPCYNGGYQAGRAELDIGAREGRTASVGAACVKLYSLGKSDALSNAVRISSPDSKEENCYLTGYQDGELSR